MDGDNAFSSWGTTGSYDWYNSPSSAGSTPAGASGSWYDGLFGLANTALQGNNAVRLQQAGNGQRYIEGQPLLVRSSGQGLTLSPGLLLLGLAAVAFVAMKD